MDFLILFVTIMSNPDVLGQQTVHVFALLFRATFEAKVFVLYCVHLSAPVIAFLYLNVLLKLCSVLT